MSPAWRKLCCYCNEVIVEEIEEGLPEGHSGLWLLPSPQGTGRVSHGICGPCFEARMAILREEAGTLPAAASRLNLRRSS